MIYPSLWLAHARARSALNGYPLYDVPHKRAERTLSMEQAQENYAYFLSCKASRLTFFQAWLRRNFRVVLSIDGAGLLALNAWVKHYGGGLIDDDPFQATTFDSYSPIWTREYAGYNVMIDIGIFLGEYLISKRPHLRWQFHLGYALAPAASKEMTSHHRPIIGGFPRGWVHDVLGQGYGSVAGSRDASHIGHNPVLATPDGLTSRCRASLHLANVADGSEPFIFLITPVSQ